MKSMWIGLLITIVAVLVIFFLVACLCALLSGADESSLQWGELKVKRSELDAVIQRYGLNSEEELREYLWFNCGTALVIEEE